MRFIIARPSGEDVVVEGGFTLETAAAFCKKNQHRCELRLEQRPRDAIQLGGDPLDTESVATASVTETTIVAYYLPATLADGSGLGTIPNYPGADVAEEIRAERQRQEDNRVELLQQKEEREAAARIAARKVADAASPLPTVAKYAPDATPITPEQASAQRGAEALYANKQRALEELHKGPPGFYAAGVPAGAPDLDPFSASLANAMADIGQKIGTHDPCTTCGHGRLLHQKRKSFTTEADRIEDDAMPITACRHCPKATRCDAFVGDVTPFQMPGMMGFAPMPRKADQKE